MAAQVEEKLGVLEALGDAVHGLGAGVEDGEVERAVVEVDWDDEAAEKGGFETFMLKEIYEQPEAVRETIGDRARRGRLELDGLDARADVADELLDAVRDPPDVGDELGAP